jgi:hypothetical protein
LGRKKILKKQEDQGEKGEGEEEEEGKLSRMYLTANGMYATILA